VIKISNISRFSKDVLIRKLIAIIIIMGVYYNLMIWLIAPQIFANPITLTALLLYYTVGGIDIMIRPLPDDKNITLVEKLIGLISLMFPFLFILAYFENIVLIAPYLPIWNDIIVAYIGITLIIIGGIIMVVSRIQLGKYGTPVVHTGEDHKLVTRGLYKYVRHPMYSGAILMMLGPFLVFRSLLVLIVIFILFMPLMRMRMKMEEETLIGTFGDEYRDYIKRTKRFIPFIV
jgi:protein-S-isoprenylcysteine O-methyltransferase Ste14